MKVKRAAPGGEGLVVDLLSPRALPRYLAGSTGRSARAGRPGCAPSPAIRSRTWAATSRPTSWRRSPPGGATTCACTCRRWPGAGDPEVAARVLADYRETVSDLLLERGVAPVGGLEPRPGIAGAQPGPRRARATCWTCTRRPTSPRPRPSGPATSRSPACTPTPNLPAHFGKPDTLFSKLASSAAHLAGRPLVSAESATWLGEHFQVAPSQVKPELDRLFLAGVNHVFLHGVTYSPADAPWPGWLFYASTDFGPESGFWPAMPALSDVRGPHPGDAAGQRSRTATCWCISRCTTCGTAAPRGTRRQAPAAPDRPRRRPLAAPAPERAGSAWPPTCWPAGACSTSSPTACWPSWTARPPARPSWSPAPGDARWPRCERLRRLAEAGAVVLFAGELPDDVPGLGALDRRRARAARGRGRRWARASERGRRRAAAGGWGAGGFVRGARRRRRRWRPRACAASGWRTWGSRCCASGAGRRPDARTGTLLPGQPGQPPVRGVGAAGHARPRRRW